MEIYLEFAENKAIGAKRQGQQEESTLERIQTQKLHGCGERSSAAAQLLGLDPFEGILFLLPLPFCPNRFILGEFKIYFH